MATSSTAGAPVLVDGGDGMKRQRSGRRPSPVWEYYTVIHTDHNTIHAQCNFCQRQCAGVAARMVNHIAHKCRAAPQDAIDALSSEIAKRRKVKDDQAEQSVVAAARPAPQSIVKPVSRVKQTLSLPPPPAPTIIVTGEPLSSAQVATAHQQLVLACVLNDIPLRFVEDKALSTALQTLRPDFPLLTAHAAQTSVLAALQRDAVRTVDVSLLQVEHCTLVHRSCGDNSSIAAPALWINVDSVNEPQVLAQTRGVDASGDVQRLRDAEAELSAQLARFPATATLGFCTESEQLHAYLRERQHATESVDSEDAAPAPDARVKAALLSVCLVRATAVLQQQLLDIVPAVATVLQEAAAVVDASVTHPRLSASVRASAREFLDLVQPPADAASRSNNADQVDWDLSPRLVKFVLALEAKLQPLWASDSNAAGLPPYRAAFWTELRAVDALLAPFSWAFALSASDSCDVSSAQFVLLWLWLVAIAHASPALVAPEQCRALTTYVVDTIREHVDDHALACLLLDPRVHGAGLSATGKRKVKGLVVQVAARVFPDAGFHTAGTPARAHLLAHLGHYAQRSAQFEDEIVWEMSAGKPAELFWRDYVEDARELATVARAVVQFVPHTQSSGVRAAVAAAAPAPALADATSAAGTSPEAEVAFQIRQIKQLYAPSSEAFESSSAAPSATNSVARPRVTAEAAIAKHASLLLPIGSSPASVTVSARHARGASVETPSTARDTATLVPLARLLERALVVDSLSSSSSASPGSSRQPDAAPEDDAMGDESPAPTKKKAGAIAVDDAWFAFRSASERKEIEAAVQRFVLV